jgi:riboflavin synthase
MVNEIAVAKVANPEVMRFTAPDVLKIPACAKRMFSEGAEAVVVYLNATTEDKHALDLVHEKIIDLEMDYGKFVFFCIVFRDEWRTEEKLAELSAQRLEELIELIAKIVHAPELAQPVNVPPEVGAGMAMFSREPQIDEDEAHGLF